MAGGFARRAKGWRQKVKKIIAAMVCIMLAFSFAGCGAKEQAKDLADKAGAEKTAGEGNAAAGGDVCPAIMVGGTVYYDTGCKSSIGKRCGVMDGEITEQCSSSEVPAKNNQSNFGTGYGYQYGAEGTIEVLMDDGNWYIFTTKEVKGAGSYR